MAEDMEDCVGAYYKRDARNPQYANKTTRISSFIGWPADKSQSPEVLAEGGFYYTGKDDCTTCFYCGGCLKNWLPGDEPIVEHARWFPDCKYVLNESEDSATLELTQASKGDIEQLKEAEGGVSIEDSGDIEQLKEAEGGVSIEDSGDFEQLKEAEGGVSIEDSGSENEHVKNLKEEILELKQQMKCIMCLDKDLSMMFLPCGHFVTCDECCQKFNKNCPVCRAEVTSKVKAYMCR